MFGSVEKAGEEQKNHMKKQYAVLGLGRFGYAVAVTLAQAGNQVLAVDSSEELVQEISDYVTYAVRADITDTNVFASLGISDMDVVIVGIAQNMQASILATIQSKEAGVPYVIAKCLSKIHADILTRVGADKVIMAEYETGVRLAKNLISGGFRDLFELSDDFSGGAYRAGGMGWKNTGTAADPRRVRSKHYRIKRGERDSGECGSAPAAASRRVFGNGGKK